MYGRNHIQLQWPALFVCDSMLNLAKVKAEPTPNITIFSNGGLFNADEIKGEELEAGITVFFM